MEALPVGAEYTGREKRASVSVKKLNDGTYAIVANCDSLTLLITERETELHRLRGFMSEYVEQNTQTVEIQKPKPLQWFFIYSGYLLWAIFFLGITYKIIKWKMKI